MLFVVLGCLQMFPQLFEGLGGLRVVGDLLVELGRSVENPSVVVELCGVDLLLVSLVDFRGLSAMSGCN